MEGLAIAERIRGNLTKKNGHFNHAKAEENNHLDQIKEGDRPDNGATKKGRAILGRGNTVQVYRATKATKNKNGTD